MAPEESSGHRKHQDSSTLGQIVLLGTSMFTIMKLEETPGGHQNP